MFKKPYDQETETISESGRPLSLSTGGDGMPLTASERIRAERIRRAEERIRKENEYAAVHCGCLRCKIAAGFQLDAD